MITNLTPEDRKGGMKNIYVYILIIGVILFIAGLWLSQRVEGFQSGTSQLLLGAIGTDGTVYIADAGLTSSPNWSSTSGTMKQISGSFGQFIGVNSSNAVFYGTQKPSMPFVWAQIGSTTTSDTQVSFDYPKVAAVMGNSVGYIPDITVSTPLFTMLTPPVAFKWIDISVGSAYAIGTDNKIYYCPNITASQWAWSDVTKSLSGSTFSQVSYDTNSVVVLTTDNRLWSATNVASPAWTELTGKAVKQMTLKNKNIFAIGTDNSIWYSPSDTNATWSKVSGNMIYVDSFYPITSTIFSGRSAGNAYCEPGYKISGNKCVSECPIGQIEGETQCFTNPTTRTINPPNTIPYLTYTCDATYQANFKPGAKCVSLINNTESSKAPLSEVFFVKGELTQLQAEAKCASYGANLATAAQIIDAANLGALACSWGWTAEIVSTNRSLAHMCPDGTAAPPRNANDLHGANCYGVKPPPTVKDTAKPTDTVSTTILPFTKVESTEPWNQAPQCDAGYVLKLNATCQSICPEGTFGNTTYCNYQPTNKTSTAKVNVNFTCPTGYDPPDVTACSKMTKSEVFFVTGKLTKAQAQAKCTSYGATLATAAQLEDALNQGGRWCSWGWTAEVSTDRQVAHLCDNFIPAGDPNQLFGANCYGVKPAKTVNTPILNFAIIEAIATIPYTEFWNQDPHCETATPICYESCPVGFIRNGTTCTKVDLKSKPAGTAAPAITYSCPAGYTLNSSNTCDQNCPSGYTAISNVCSIGAKIFSYPTRTCTDANYPIVMPPSMLNNQTVYRCKNNKNAIGPRFAVLKCPETALNIGSNLSCYTCPAVISGTSSRLEQDTCTDIPLRIMGQASTKTTICPDGYELDTEGTICYEKCAAGFTLSVTTDSSNKKKFTCTPPTNVAASATTRKRSLADFIFPCPADHTLIGTTCYADCKAGDNDLGKQCQTPAQPRTTKPSTISTPSTTVCNPDSEFINNNCVKKCPTGKISTNTTCSDSATNRTVKSLKYTTPCNSNEDIVNDMCLTKCPSGRRDGSTCVPGKERVAPPSSIKCTSSTYGKYMRWICQSQEDVDSLSRDPSATTMYADENDQVCSTDSPTTMMYFCQTVAEAREGADIPDKIKSIYGNTCSQLIKNYLDLNETLSNLRLLESGVNDGTTGLQNANTSLRRVYENQGCLTNTTTPLCTRMQNGIKDIDGNVTSISSMKSQLSGYVQQAVAEREKLLASIRDFQCQL